MQFSIKDFPSKFDQILSLLRIWSHLLEKSLMENYIFCAVQQTSDTIPRAKKEYIFLCSKYFCSWTEFHFLGTVSHIM